MVNKDMTKVCIGKVNELPEELGKTVYIEDKELAVFKLSDGSVRAVENRCPHKGASWLKASSAENTSSARCMTGKSP